MTNWQVTERDRQLWNDELESFVPPKIFDSHVHLYEQSQFQGAPPALCAEGPAVVNWSEFQSQMNDLMPGRQIGGTCFGFPAITVDFAATNDFLAQECDHRAARAQLLISPAMDADYVREQVLKQRFVGLKPYHLFATTKPTFAALIENFLTPAHMQVAHELGLTITLHIVRSRALADRANQETLERYARQFPNARMILAHAARGFNPQHTLAGIHALRDLRNIWFDTSAVTDAGALEAIIRTCGHRQLLYGSDFPVSHLRGRCVAIGDSFLWLSPANTNLAAPYADVQFTLVALESLRTLKVACYATGLSDSQVLDIFYENSADLWNARF
ncbi:Amidohydrolase [Anatilimnocola aggregata]|uniref:Amidohydrolase n=1 Tax=Anatilimnocola aggregata TaxID=2528021 RepID=A0A517Y769_9BACT|nr:amidohydrolase family protein [Anatilimnocola aggregata]QDU26080.1 Amidohydrolase [Anatilimnocola aggregata]